MADTSSYQESQSGTLDWYNKAVQDLLAKGQTQSNQALKQYTGNQVAGFTPQQTQAFNLAGSNVGNWKPALNSATAGVNKAITTGQQAQGAVPGAINAYNAASAGVAGLGGSGAGALSAFQNAQKAGKYDPNQVQNYLNPYLGGVIDEIARLGNENFTNVLNPAVANQFGGLGQYGSARQALATGQAAGDTQKAISGQQASTLKDAYDSAMQGYYNFSNLGANTGISAGQGLGNLAQLQANTNTSVGQGLSGLGEWGTSAGIQGAQRLTDIGNATQQAGIADYGTLFNAGQAQQQLEQNKLNVAKAQFDEKQQYPWQQLGNYQQLFGVTTPQQSSSWSTTLKKGGLVRYAEGGRFPRGEEPGDWPELNDRYSAGQSERESLRRLMLERELGYAPDDPNSHAILRELADMEGVSPADMMDEPGLAGNAPLLGQILAQAELPRDPKEDRHQKRVSSLFDQIGGSFQPREAPTQLQQIGRAMLASAAQGPANYGQLLGRAGDAYFSNEDTLREDNQRRESVRFGLQEKLLDQLKRSGGSSGSMKLFRGKDGSQWGVDSGTGEKTLLYPGSYDEKINSLALDAAKKSLDSEGQVFHTTAEYEQALMQRINAFRQHFAAGFAGLGATVQTPGTNGPVGSESARLPGGQAPRPMSQPTPPQPENRPGLGGASPSTNPPAGIFTGDLDAARQEIGAIRDPNERAAALAAFEQSQTEAPPLFQIPKIKSDDSGAIVPKTVQKSRENDEIAAGKYYSEEFLPAVESAQGLAESSKQLLAMDLPTGKLANVKELLGSVAEAFHIDSSIVDAAEKLQSARPILKRMQNEVMLAAKGVQTEGDAQRAIDQFIKLEDTPNAAKEIARIATATGYMADLANRYSQQYIKENSDQMRGMRSTWRSYRTQNLPLFKINPKTKKPIYLNEWVKAVQDKGGSEAEALRDWPLLSQ